MQINHKGAKVKITYTTKEFAVSIENSKELEKRVLARLPKNRQYDGICDVVYTVQNIINQIYEESEV